MSENPVVHQLEYAGLKMYERMRYSRRELLNECRELVKTLPEQEAEVEVDKKIQAWMIAQETNNKYKLILDLAPSSSHQQTGDRVFIGTDDSSMIVLEPYAYNNHRYSIGDVREPARKTFFIDPSEMSQIMALTSQMVDIEKMFERPWKISQQVIGSHVLQLNPFGLQAKIKEDKQAGTFTLDPGTFRPIDDRDLFIQSIYLTRKEVVAIRKAPPTRQKAKAA